TRCNRVRWSPRTGTNRGWARASHPGWPQPRVQWLRPPRLGGRRVLLAKRLGLHSGSAQAVCLHGRHGGDRTVHQGGSETRKFGFTLSEVEILLHLGRGGPADCEAVRALATEKLLDLESRVASLKAMHHSLEQLIATCEGGRASAFLARYLGSQLRLVRGGCRLRNRSRTFTNGVSRSALDVVGHEIQFQTAQATPGSRQRPAA